MEKPLPEIPQPLSSAKNGLHAPANWATLTVDGRNHLRRFILHCLEEAQDVIPLNDREACAVSVEVALDELGERVAMGGWLAGVRRARRRKVDALEKQRAKHSITRTGVTADGIDATPRPDSNSYHGELKEDGYFSLGRLDGIRPSKEAATPTRQDLLASLRVLAEKQAPPTPKPTAKHVLLTVSPSKPVAAGDSDRQCVFTPGVFAMPNDEESSGSAQGEILYGWDSWEQLLIAENSSLQLVGGTFSLSVVQDEQYRALVKVLRLSVFTYLSIILEQSLLADFHVPLRFPKLSNPPPKQADGVTGVAMTRALSTGHVSRKASSKRESGLWAFFSKKKDDIIQRATPSLARRGSLELPIAQRPVRSRSPLPAPCTSHDGGRPSPANLQRIRRFSFISDYRPSFMQPLPDQDRKENKKATVEHPISLALAAVEKARGYLSTSPDVFFEPPSILVKLAAREKTDQHPRLGGDDKAALGSLLGWDTKSTHLGSCGAGMVDTTGFVRQQSLSLLYSEWVPKPPSRPPSPSSAIEQPRLIPCGKHRRWLTFRYYSQADECLGETVLRMCSRADQPCDNPDCRTTRGKHELRLLHADTLITILVSGDSPLVFSADDQPAEMWSSCRICKKETPKIRMHDGSYLLSFSKFLELLVYSSSLCSISPPLCEHTALPSRPWGVSDMPLPRSRLNISRHFAHGGRVMSITLSQVHDIYDVRVPRLQIIRSKFEKPDERDSEGSPGSIDPVQVAGEADRRLLRREIMQFWQCISEQMDTLEGNFIQDHAEKSHHKSLPRLPSADEAYESFDDAGFATPKGHPSNLPPHPPNTPMTPKTNSAGQLAFPFPQKLDIAGLVEHPADGSRSSISVSDSTSWSQPTSLELLTSMRHTFQRTEQNLYAELSRAQLASLNDVRRSFVSAGRGATKRLSAWEVKHASGPSIVSEASAHSEPEWWKTGCHAVPGGNVIVRENDWGSIIAFTLSATDYHQELANMAVNRKSSVPSGPPPTPELARPSFFAKTTSSRWFAASGPIPDPDQDDVVWHEPETYSAVISRKEHPKDTASILKLGITDVLRQKTQPDAGGSSTPSRLGNTISSGGKAIVPSAWAKPDVQISKQAADGHLSASSKDGMDKILHDLEAVSEPTPRSVRSSWSDQSHLSSSGFVETNIRRGKTASIMSTDSDATTVGGHSRSSHHTEPPGPNLPPKDIPEAEHVPESSTSSSRPPTIPSTPSTSDQPSLTSTITNTVSSALRYMLKSGTPPPVSLKHHHGLLLAGSPAIDERPHIKYDWTIGKRLKFSCTVYYAKQFDALRRRCGIEDTFLRSLSRSENWVAEGGKSRSNFWKTSDDQFIIKTLVNAWNVADLHVLIELGPTYFRHMDATANKPTVLAKLLGFYTVEIRNLETGSTQAKADLLVMENLFYKQNIVKTFDLKGIQGRKVKAASSDSGSKTLFDGDWIEGQQRALSLVQPHSKVVLQEAIRADSDFLARSNIMDYSLLLGIDEERKQIACGLVDTIGSYTFAKTLEYKAKQNLSSGKEVTVIPPNEYQERFVNAMDNYFVACPDKWSKPLDNTKIPSEYQLLPSVI